MFKCRVLLLRASPRLFVGKAHAMTRYKDGSRGSGPLAAAAAAAAAAFLEAWDKCHNKVELMIDNHHSHEDIVACNLLDAIAKILCALEQF